VRAPSRPGPTRRALVAALLGGSTPALGTDADLAQPEGIFAELDLRRPALRPVQEALRAGDPTEASQRLLAWYRRRSVPQLDSVFAPQADPSAAPRADRLLDQHLFDMGFGYPPQRYGDDIDWRTNPVGDIEWVAAVQRFAWQDDLLAASLASRHPKYPAGWVRLTSDWMRKHFPVDPQRFEWLDIQAGLRGIRWCIAFEAFRRSPAIDGPFLLAFLAAVHAHARKSYRFALRRAHNKAVIEAVGLLYLAVVFTEFREASQWRARALELLSSTVDIQVTPEGVQREWTPSYHMLVAALLVEAMWLLKLNGYRLPRCLRRHVDRLCDVWVAMTAPDGSPPLFGDTQGVRPARLSPATPARAIQRAALMFQRPDWASFAEGRLARLRMPSRAFPKSGLYFLRTGWQPEDVFLALHCSPPAISGHDQPDNGTFELYAYGRWLMPDSGSYSYPNTPSAPEREWFRRTAVHQTLTLNQANSQNRPRHLLWADTPGLQCVAFENESYPGLVHRRTVFFLLEGPLFVLLDEALGLRPGLLELHFQFTPGPFQLDDRNLAAFTDFPDGANVLLCWPRQVPVTLHPEPGQYSERLNQKVARPAIAVRHRDPPPAWFLTLLVPYKGRRPAAAVRAEGNLSAGQSRVIIEVQVGERHWRAGRDLATRRVWRQEL